MGDTTCHNGKLGCLADGTNMQCRYCGAGEFESIACPNSYCVGVDTNVAYAWDSTCELGMLGCAASPLYVKCRYCGHGVYENITCADAPAALPTNVLYP